MNPVQALLFLPGLMVGLTLHEFAHAWSASLLGDDFARRQGRISFNPLRHLSLLGTLALLLLPFGWGKPVQVNLYNFKHPRRDYLISSLAGPAANALVVAICISLMQLTRHCYRYGPGAEPWLGVAHLLLELIALINAVLAVVNLIPIPPLDGSKIWTVLVPGWKPGVPRKSSSLFLILLVMLAATNSLGPMIDGALSRIMVLMPPLDRVVYDGLIEQADKAVQDKQWDQAERLYTQAMDINSNDSNAWLLSSRASGGKPTAASSCLTRSPRQWKAC